MRTKEQNKPTVFHPVNFDRALRALEREHDRWFSQMDLANRVGCCPMLIAKTRAGYVPSKRLRSLIAATLNISAGELWSGEMLPTEAPENPLNAVAEK